MGVTRRLGEAEVKQIDAKETAKKSDGAKTRSWAGATQLFGPSVSKVNRGGRSRPAAQQPAPRVLAPSPQGGRSERTGERKRRKQKCQANRKNYSP